MHAPSGIARRTGNLLLPPTQAATDSHSTRPPILRYADMTNAIHWNQESAKQTLNRGESEILCHPGARCCPGGPNALCRRYPCSNLKLNSRSCELSHRSRRTRPNTQDPSLKTHPLKNQKPKTKDLSVSRAHSVNGCVLMPYRLFPSIRALVAGCYTPANEVQGPARQSPKNPPAAN